MMSFILEMYDIQYTLYISENPTGKLEETSYYFCKCNFLKWYTKRNIFMYFFLYLKFFFTSSNLHIILICFVFNFSYNLLLYYLYFSTIIYISFKSIFLIFFLLFFSI